MHGEQPARVSDRIIEEIRAREVAGFVRLPPAPQPRHGDPVRLIRGPLEGQLGLYQGQNGRERTRILLGWLGRSVMVTVPSEHLAI
jgi:transcription antitermination factor NusG